MLQILNYPNQKIIVTITIMKEKEATWDCHRFSEGHVSHADRIISD